MDSSSSDTKYLHYYWVLWSECFINLWETKLLWNLNQSTHTHIQKPDTIHATKTQENSSLIYSLFYSPIFSHSLGSFTHSIIYLLNHSLTNLLTHSPVSLFPHLLTRVTHSLTHSPVTHSLLTHSLLTHSLLTHSLLTHCSLTHRKYLGKPPWSWWFNFSQYRVCEWAMSE